MDAAEVRRLVLKRITEMSLICSDTARQSSLHERMLQHQQMKIQQLQVELRKYHMQLLHQQNIISAAKTAQQNPQLMVNSFLERSFVIVCIYRSNLHLAVALKNNAVRQRIAGFPQWMCRRWSVYNSNMLHSCEHNNSNCR